MLVAFKKAVLILQLQVFEFCSAFVPTLAVVERSHIFHVQYLQENNGQG